MAKCTSWGASSGSGGGCRELAMDVVQFAANVIGTVGGALGIFYITTAIISPVWFHKAISIEAICRKYENEIINYTLGLIVLFSVGRVIFCALYAVTYSLPPSWGSLNEDGDWVTVDFWARSTLACIGCFLVMPALEKSAAQAFRSEILRRQEAGGAD